MALTFRSPEWNLGTPLSKLAHTVAVDMKQYVSHAREVSLSRACMDHLSSCSSCSHLAVPTLASAHQRYPSLAVTCCLPPTSADICLGGRGRNAANVMADNNSTFNIHMCMEHLRSQHRDCSEQSHWRTTGLKCSRRKAHSRIQGRWAR